MGWKKKEKPLTPDEAIAAAKRDLAPFWFNSDPLLAAVRSPTGVSVLPLNSGFTQHAWVYAFIDPTEFAGERGLQMIREWHRRYSPHKLGFIVVFKAAAPFVKSAPDLLKKFQAHFTAMYDQDGMFATAFGIESWPAVVIQNGGQEIARSSGANWFSDIEEKIQVFLRTTDPGLSTPVPFEVVHPVVGQSRMDFGTLNGRPIQSYGSLIQVSGQWKENEDCISTHDQTAVVAVSCPSSVMAIIAQAANGAQVTKLIIEPVDGAMAREWVYEATQMDDGGNAVLRVQLFSLYYLLKDLPENRRKFRLSFPDADTFPISIYGFRFGTKS